MRMLVSVLILLAKIGVGQAGEKDILKALKDAGVGEITVIHAVDTVLVRYRCHDFRGLPGTDYLLVELCEHRQVRGLLLEQSDLTDAGMASIGGLRGLVYLSLDSTAITDTGLRHLEKMKGLQVLNLRRCPNVTDEGVARLQKALPECEIRR
jgi:hypothetical protein